MRTIHLGMSMKALAKTSAALAWAWICALAFGVSIANAQEAASNSIENVEVSSLAGGKVVLRVALKNTPSGVPAGFAINNPPRIALDFANTVNGTGKSSINVGEGAVRNLNLVQAGSRTRLVLNLARPVGYDTKIEGNALIVTVQNISASARSSANIGAQFAEERGASQAHSVRDVDFRRGEAGEGKIVVDLSDKSTGIDIRQQGRLLVVDFVNTSVPRNLEKRLDVTDFGTPVQTVEIKSRGPNTRMTIEPKGTWEHSAYQTDQQFIVDIKPIIEDPTKLQSRSKGYTGEKLSLNFQNVEVRSVLQVIADFTGLNIITSDTVGGNLTLRLKDVPWDQALDIILQSKGLSMRKNGNVILIAPSDELATKEKLELEAKRQISELEPVYPESFRLKYQKAEAIQKLLTDEAQRVLSKRGSAAIDGRTNTVFVQDTSAKLDEVRRLINQIDVAVRQVMIEARIVIADDKFSKQLGVRFGSKSGHNVSNYNIGVSGSLETSGPIAAGTAPTGSSGLNVNLPVTSPAGSLALTILNLGSGNLINLELSALESDGRGKVISSPRVITADQQLAFIEQGTEIPYLQASSSGATNVAFKPAVLSLSVTPQITPDDKIVMTLEVKKDSVGQIFAGIPSIDTKKVKTQILVDNGETAVLGGIFEQVSRDTLNKVPLLGDIPVVGTLFKNTNRQDDKTELLIFITPRIINEAVTVR